MKCREMYLHICENLDQDIDSPQCAAIKAHLEGCPDCQVFLDSLKKTIVLYRAVPSPKVPARARRELLRTIEGLASKRTRRTKARPRRRA